MITRSATDRPLTNRAIFRATYESKTQAVTRLLTSAEVLDALPFLLRYQFQLSVRVAAPGRALRLSVALEHTKNTILCD